jgi:DNA-binding SARP family transcriptional activator
MDSLHSPERDALIVASENSSPGHLLEAGFLCVRQGRYIEGLALFALVRERLSPNQVYLATALDAFMQGHKTYLQAQEELLQASKHFARADAEQQAQIATLENLLSILPEETKKASSHTNGLQQNARSNRLLHVLRSSSNDLNPDQLATQLPQRAADDNWGNQSLLPSPSDSITLPALYIICFRHFEVKRQGKPIVLCSNRHAQTILRYLVVQSEHRATSDTLMTLLWPEDEPEVAQPRLHTAICALRRSLNHGYTDEVGGGYIVCKNRVYYLNPAVAIRTDVEEFLQCYEAERQTNEERVAFYEKACSLYTGPFLSEDLYADWSFLQREHLNRIYLAICRVLTDHYLRTKHYEDAEKWAIAMLKVNRCDEGAHRQLIKVYAAQGRRNEALQQYQRCEYLLREELGVTPLPETTHLFQKLLISEPSSTDAAKI